MKEANDYWSTIRERVSDSKLQAKMDKAQKGLTKSSQDHDAKSGKISVKENLDLVDDLEGYFSGK